MSTAVTPNPHLNDDERRVDARVVKTREAISRAFLTLIETTPYPEITVTALAAEAHVSRKTFYLHYASVDELLSHLVKQVTHRIVSQMHVSDNSIPTNELVYNFTMDVVGTLRDYPALYTNLIRRMPLPVFLNMVRDPVMDVCRTLLKHEPSVSNSNFDYWASYYLGGLALTYETWKLTSGDPAELDAIAEFVSRSATMGLSAMIEEHGTATR